MESLSSTFNVAEAMNTEANKALDRWYVELYTTGNVALADEVIASDFVDHTHRGTFAGLPATGKKVTLTGMDFIRIANNKLAELWSNQDMLALLQQVGLQLK